MDNLEAYKYLDKNWRSKIDLLTAGWNPDGLKCPSVSIEIISLQIDVLIKKNFKICSFF